MSTTATNDSRRDQLALLGGPGTVKAAAPENWQHGPNEIGKEEIAACTAALRAKVLFRFGRDAENSTVTQFERLFAKKTNVSHVLAVNSGTSALICALIGVGVSQGDEVIVPAYTYIATAAAVLALGAIPVLAEIDESLTIDPRDIERKITSRTKAIIPVHMRGVTCDMDSIMKVARQHGLKVVEDCAQANGALYRGEPVGSIGDVGAFSLQHFKIITSGEGGAITTKDRTIFGRAAVYHDAAYAFWMEGKAAPDAIEEWKAMCFLGENYRQSELHGALALAQLGKRDRILDRTRSIKRKLWAACEAIPGARMEASNDREGDCGISLAFLMPTSPQAVQVYDALRAEGAFAGTIFSKQIPNRHIYYHWDYIMGKRTPHTNGFPWSVGGKETNVKYTADMCPRTIDLLERTVVMPITQIMTDSYVDDVVAAIVKVARLL